MTLDELVALANYSKPRISELLRGKGLYPRWEITSSVGRALGAPMWPMRRLWVNAAREADKKQSWIENCINEVPLQPPAQPLDHRALAQNLHGAYRDFARTFLGRADLAELVVNETFDILWMTWDHALTSPNVARHAWGVFRERVMCRTPRMEDGTPDLRPAAFSTQPDSEDAKHLDCFQHVQEMIDLFAAIGHLPHNPRDTIVLRNLCGLPEADVARVMGVPRPLATVFALHGRRILDANMNDTTRTGETTL
jgi:DNA-directed RNA polymerase specialized sigma24 family protein